MTDRPVALILALELEAQALVRHLTASTVPSPQLSIWQGVVEGIPVVLVITGVGKVAASLATQYTCDTFTPRSVITIGIAGATDSDALPGHDAELGADLTRLAPDVPLKIADSTRLAPHVPYSRNELGVLGTGDV